MKKKTIIKIIFIVFIIGIVFILDQYTKYLIEENIKLNESVNLIKNFFNLTYVRNTGAAFSILSGKVNLLIIISWMIFFYLIYEIYMNIKENIYPYFIAVLIGGLVGNLYDRIVFGYVRDFLDFNILGYDYPVFNISDMFVVLGVILLTVHILFKGETNGIKSKKRRRK